MNTTQEAIMKRLVAVIDVTSKAIPDDPESNPYANHDVEQLSQGKGVLKGADQIPAKSMAPAGGLGYDMEIERNAGLDRGRQDKSTKRSTQARARARRTLEYNVLAASPVVPDPARLTQAWRVVFPLVQIINSIANSKKRWASRFLGSNVDDIAQMALEQMALVLAKSSKDMDLLREAADELGGLTDRTGRVPGDQVTDDERKHWRAVKKERKWLMGFVNNRVMGALVDSYTDQHNLRWENIDLIATVIASISGVGEDPHTARFKADRAPAFLGTKFARPGGVDPAVLAAVVNAAITERGLDALVEVLLNEDNRRVDGAVRWTKCARDIFLATPDGAWKWEAVVSATEHLARANNVRGDKAREYVRDLFAFLPHVIVAAVESFDPRAIAYTSTRAGGNAIMASDFELFYLPDPKPRTVLVPRLQYATAEDAARALVDYMSELVTGEDLIASVVNA